MIIRETIYCCYGEKPSQSSKNAKAFALFIEYTVYNPQIITANRKLRLKNEE